MKYLWASPQETDMAGLLWTWKPSVGGVSWREMFLLDAHLYLLSFEPVEFIIYSRRINF